MFTVDGPLPLSLHNHPARVCVGTLKDKRWAPTAVRLYSIKRAANAQTIIANETNTHILFFFCLKIKIKKVSFYFCCFGGPVY